MAAEPVAEVTALVAKAAEPVTQTAERAVAPATCAARHVVETAAALVALVVQRRGGNCPDRHAPVAPVVQRAADTVATTVQTATAPVAPVVQRAADTVATTLQPTVRSEPRTTTTGSDQTQPAPRRDAPRAMAAVSGTPSVPTDRTPAQVAGTQAAVASAPNAVRAITVQAPRRSAVRIVPPKAAGAPSKSQTPVVRGSALAFHVTPAPTTAPAAAAGEQVTGKDPAPGPAEPSGSPAAAAVASAAFGAGPGPAPSGGTALALALAAMSAAAALCFARLLLPPARWRPVFLVSSIERPG